MGHTLWRGLTMSGMYSCSNSRFADYAEVVECEDYDRR